MALNYRSMFEIPDGADGIVLAKSHFRSWLQSKRADARSLIDEGDWRGPGTHDVGEGAHVTEVGLDQQDGSRLLRLTLEEANNAGRWVTNVTAAERPGRGSWSRFLWIETSNADESEQDVPGRDPMPPRLVRNLLEEVEGRNGAARLSARPAVVRGDDTDAIEALLSVILDADRAVPVVAGASFERLPLDAWLEVVEQLTRFGIGLLSTVVLDPSATADLNSRLGPEHAVPTGGVRTFYPGVLIGDGADAIRHRYITPSTMLQVVRRRAAGGVTVRPALAHAVAWNARRTVLDAGLPGRVRRVDALLRREHARAAAPAHAARSAVPDETQDLTQPVAASLLRLGEMVKQIFESDEISDDDVVRFSQLVSAMARDVPALEAEVAVHDELLTTASVESEQLRRDLKEAELAAAVAERERRDLERKVLWYEKALKDARRYEALAMPAEPGAPEDIAELLERLVNETHDDRHQLLDHVIFTGNADVSEELLRYDTLGRIAGAAWDVLLTLGDYADAKKSEESPPRNIFEYLRETPAGRHAVSLQRYVPAESDSVRQNPQWRAERTFPVPRHIEATGTVFMGAHFRLGGGDMVSPRLYVHDAVDMDGRVYIGYIGRHLTNTKT